MKYIQKDREPECFTTWKNRANEDWQPSYHVLRDPEKKEVWCSLIREQGHICCYCQSRITRPTSHIEHFRPQSGYPMHELDYGNLLASCNCGENHPGLSECDEPPLENETEEVAITLPKHCGQFKGDWHGEGLISPLEPDCETYFYYEALTGKIRPSNDLEKGLVASMTIDRLGLNSTGLVRRRQIAFDTALQGMETWTDADAKHFIEGYNHKDDYGRFVPFCSAIVSVINDYFP